tara:strand:- start:42 stop:1211 length:1170 start_codon:yes stop_codon:yes gene_type:complete
MVVRRLEDELKKRVNNVPVVALLGSRQVGKTTLAKGLKLDKAIHYLDLERPSDIAKLSDPELYLNNYAGSLVILDEIQRVPEIFPVLRSLVDERKELGERSAQFLILGSASPELLRQSSETLAGRISYLELSPLSLLEVGGDQRRVDDHWFRGGYPDSYLGKDDEIASQWCEDFITSYVERYLPQQGVTMDPVVFRRFFSMLAYQQGSLLNLSTLGRSLGIDGKTVRHYIDILDGLYLLRRLPAWSRNAGKRLVKSPKVYLRDSGILHSLIGLESHENVLGHPICGHSWEGYSIEQILSVLPKGCNVCHYRTHAGAEVDLVLEYSQGHCYAIEIKRTVSPKLTPAFRESMKTLKAKRGYYVTPIGETYPLSDEVDAISLLDFLKVVETL